MKTIEPIAPPNDEVLAEVHRHKREIAKEHGFDVRALARDLRRRQASHPQLISPQQSAGMDRRVS